MDWQIYLAAAAQVLNVTVPTMFRAARNCSCTLFTNFLFDIISAMADMYVLRIRWESNNATQMLTGADEFSFAFVPDVEDVFGGCTT
jgi:hypothetical protein